MLYRVFLIFLFPAIANAAIYPVSNPGGDLWGVRLRCDNHAQPGVNADHFQNQSGNMDCSICNDSNAGGGAASFTVDQAQLFARLDTQGSGVVQCRNANNALVTQQQGELLYCNGPGETYNADNHTCHVDTPQCQEADHKIYAIDFGGDIQYYCSPDFDETDEECENPISDFNGDTICGDAKEECENSGGTYGYVGGEQTCISDDYEDDILDCNDAEIPMILNGEIVCTSPVDVDESHDTPETDTPHEVDTDGDGTPDNDDDDIDGDGTPNGTDNDIDGDGIDNDDDPTPNGQTDEEGDGEESSVDGGGSCTIAPKCTGDAVQCAILFQTWAQRCKGGTDRKLTGGGDCGNPPDCTGDAIDCAIANNVWAARCENRRESQDELDGLITELGTEQLFTEGEEFSEILGDVYNQTGSSGSCPSPLTMNIAGTSIDVTYQSICDLAEAIKPIVIIGFSFLAFGFLMRAF